MADWIRIMIARRRTIFKSEGRSERWVTLKLKIVCIIQARKSKYYEGLRDKFLANSSSKNFHSYLKALLEGNMPPRWDVRSMAPDKPDLKLAEWMADFFNEISSEYSPLNKEEIPTSYEASLPSLSV